MVAVEQHITLQIMAVLVVLVLGAQEEVGHHPILRVEMELLIVGVEVEVQVLALAAQLSPVVPAALA